MRKTLLFLPLLCLFTACEEVIELDLESSAQRLVAEANLNATDSTCTLRLSRSGDFYANNNFEAIEGATVSLLATDGEIPLTDRGNGQYGADNLGTAVGETVQLSIALPDGTRLQSEAVTVPQPALLDTVMVEKVASGGPGSGPPGSGSGSGAEQYALTVEWRDPVGSADFYRFKIYRNGTFLSDLYLLADDRLGDGLKISRPVIGQTFDKGDTLRVQMLSVSKAYHRYFSDLANAQARGLSAPVPYNPQGNWAPDEILGVFGAWFIVEKTVIAQ